MADTGWLSASTITSDSSVGDRPWANPSNAISSDDSYATTNGDSFTYEYNFDKTIKLVVGGSVVGDNKASGEWGTTDSYSTYGSDSDLWGITPSLNDINDELFGVVIQCTGSFSAYDSYYLKATNFGFSIPENNSIDGIIVEVEKKSDSGGSYPVAYVDHIRIKVFYTETGVTITANTLLINSSQQSIFLSTDQVLSQNTQSISSSQPSITIIEGAGVTLSTNSQNISFSVPSITVSGDSNLELSTLLFGSYPVSLNVFTTRVLDPGVWESVSQLATSWKAESDLDTNWSSNILQTSWNPGDGTNKNISILYNSFLAYNLDYITYNGYYVEDNTDWSGTSQLETAWKEN